MQKKKTKYGSDFAKVDKHIIQPEEYEEAPFLTDEALDRAVWFSNGIPVEIETHVPKIRAKTNMTQKEFSKTFGFPLSTLRKWEQGLRKPNGAAMSLLTIIDHNPELALEALNNH